ncbi:ATPase domain-containing protein [Rugosibacter aromaticivorans]|nr:ATPase domain-containing protein [Rugosibacter aromaticivorans]
MRKSVEEEDGSMVMVDSLRGYHLAMEEFGKSQVHIHNLVNYLTRTEVTTLFVNETEHLFTTSLRATNIGVSHPVDNIVMLRYAEQHAKLVKLFTCLKKRAGDFEYASREMKFIASGIKIGEKLQHLRGILSGSPQFDERRAP